MDGKLKPMEFEAPVRSRTWTQSRWTKGLVMAAATLGLAAVGVFALAGTVVSRPMRPGVSDQSLHVYNETLGFGEIILLSLPERTDRQDSVSLLASQYDVKISKTIYGVHGEDVVEKALPFGIATTGRLPINNLGSWRSHMTCFKYIVDNRIESALLLEDDIDWDVQVKDELYALSKAMRASQIRPPLSAYEAAAAPYGLDWDIFHFAAGIIEPAPEPYESLAVRYLDPYRNPGSESGLHWKTHDWAAVFEATNNTKLTDHRVVIPSHNSKGLAALGVTYEGARRIMYELEWVGLHEGLDGALSTKLIEGRLRGYTVAPPIMGSWRIGGPADSDLKKVTGPANNSNADGVSMDLMYSARKAFKKDFEARASGWSPERFGIES